MMQQLPQLRIHWLDGSGSKGETRVTISAILPVATIESAAPSLVAALSGCSDAAFTGYEIVYNVVPSAAVTAGTVVSVVRCGVFIFEDIGLGTIGLVEVHSILDDLLVTSGYGEGVLIIQDDSRVVDFVQALHDAGATNPLGDTLGELVEAYRQSRV